MEFSIAIKSRTFIFVTITALIVLSIVLAYFVSEKRKADKFIDLSQQELEKARDQKDKEEQTRQKIDEIKAERRALAAQRGVSESDLSPLDKEIFNRQLVMLDEKLPVDDEETKCIFTGYDCLNKAERAQIGLSTDPQILEAWNELWYVELSVKKRTSDGVLTPELAQELDAAVNDIANGHANWLGEFHESMLPAWARLEPSIENETSPQTKPLWENTFEILDSMTRQIAESDTDAEKRAIYDESSAKVEQLKSSNSTFADECNTWLGLKLKSIPNFWQARAYAQGDFRFSYP